MPRRRLSADDEAIWARVTATTERLETETAIPMPAPMPTLEPRAEPGAAPPLAKPAPRQNAAARTSWDLAPEPGQAPDRPHPHMDRGRYEKLRRGRLHPEGRLDLHGLTADNAHAALVACLLDAHARGLRLVLVITGKGRPGGPDALAPHRHGILRHALPHWLKRPPLAGRVLDMVPAHQRHGGGGAFYVYLRRAR
jgi:DNA-nicking Smr family endonuclease